MPVRVPQVRDVGEPYRSTLMGFLEENSEVLERLVMEMYARGLSTRDVEDAFRDATGELVISRSAVSEITDGLWEQYEAFCARDLSDIPVEYLFCDGIYESLRATAPRRRCWSPGVLTPTAANICCTFRSATRSPRRTGPSSSGT